MSFIRVALATALVAVVLPANAGSYTIPLPNLTYPETPMPSQDARTPVLPPLPTAPGK